MRSTNTKEKTMATRLVMVVTLLSLCLISFAESPKQEAAAAAKTRDAGAALNHPDATFQCAYSFASGSGNTYLDYCVTVNGNITYLETPKGHAHIGGEGEFSSFGEGYGICNGSPEITEYHDWAGFGDSGNWNAPVLMSHTATSVKIARTTSDGIWTLTQTITLVAATPAIKITMQLKNNTAVDRSAYLVRYADADADATFLNNLDATQNTAAAWNPLGSLESTYGHNYGLLLQNVGTPTFGYWQGFAPSTPNPPNACAFAYYAPGSTLIQINGSLVMSYVDTIAHKGSKTAILTYRGM
jgi:hypothetical protein